MKNPYTILPVLLIAFIIFVITSSINAQTKEYASKESPHYQSIINTVENLGVNVNAELFAQEMVLKTNELSKWHQVLKTINNDTIINTFSVDTLPKISIESYKNGSTHEFITEYDYNTNVEENYKKHLANRSEDSLINHEIIGNDKIKQLTKSIKADASEKGNGLIVITDDSENIRIERNGELIFLNKQKQIEKIDSNMEIVEDKDGKNVLIVQTKITLDNENKNNSKALKSDNKAILLDLPKFEYVKFYANQSENSLNIEFKLEETDDVTVKVVDMLGRNIYYETRTNYSGQYNKSIYLNSQSKGPFILQIAQGNRFITRKTMLK